MRYKDLTERCWTGYKQVGMKKKGDRMVPNCVSVEETRRDPTELFKPADKELDELHHKYIPTWTMLDHHILEQTYVFADDDTAEQFIDQVNEFSEAMDHNAVITQDNAEVKLQVTTNDVKGLTELDFQFALRADNAAAKSRGQAKGHPTNALNENQEKYILYLNDKPIATYPSSREADIQSKMILQKFPDARVTVKKEVCTLTPVQLAENLRDWFKQKWVRFGPDGKIRGACARGSSKEGKPKCLPQAKAHALGKKGRASAAARKRRQDPNPERKGKAINVKTKRK